MGKDKAKKKDSRERLRKVCPTFSLDESLRDYLRENNIQLSDACINRVKNLCHTSFISNPAEMSEKFFVRKFTKDRKEKDMKLRVDRRGTCTSFLILPSV